MTEGRFPFFIQPVYDRRLNWNGFNLIFREDASIPPDGLPQLAEEWAGFASKPDFRFFLPFHPDWPQRETPEIPLPAERVVFVLPPGQAQDGDLLARCKALKAKGFRFALRSDAASILSRDETANIAVLDATEARATIPDAVWRRMEPSELRLFAAGIDSMELFEWCAEKRFAFHTFACMSGFRGRKDQLHGSSKAILMKMLTLISQDAEIDELESTIHKEPKLAFDLLRLVNSASMGMRTRVSSFSHALTILGRRQLQRWLQLLLFAHQKEGASGPSILMQRAAARGRLMELLARPADGPASLEFQEQAFMVGLFSLLDILLDLPMEDILQTLLLADNLEAALLRREGVLGEMLQLAIDTENLDFDAAARQLDKLRVSAEAFCQAQAAALNWTHRLNVIE